MMCIISLSSLLEFISPTRARTPTRYGVGQGYCKSPSEGNSTDCPPFAGLTCPCVPKSDTESRRPPPPRNCPAATPSSGDILVPVYQHFEFPLHPDPTNPKKPMHMYNMELGGLKTGNTYQVCVEHM